jgi:hypothetical protein
VRGKLSLEGDLWPEDDMDMYDEETEAMTKAERDRLVMFMRAIVDAGVTPQAQEDALRWLEQHYEGQDPDAIDVRGYCDTTMRRQKSHYWP